MFEGYRVVAVTPAGRRRYMELLVPQILASPLVDRYDIWVNTANPGDLAFLEGLAKRDARVRLVPQPDGKVPGPGAIHGFHREAADPDTIYIRFDDDVVWLEPGFFETLLRFRLEHPEHFLVMPLVINNAICSNLLQTLGKITAWKYIHTYYEDRIGWRRPEFAIALHRFFIDLIDRGETARLHSGAHVIAMNRFSINCTCWFGRDLAAFGGEVGIEEEEEMSAAIPVRLGRTNCFCTDTVVAHFAFYSQRAWIDTAGILEEYGRILSQRPEIAGLLREVGDIRRAADARNPGPAAEGGAGRDAPDGRPHPWLRAAKSILRGRFKEDLDRVWIRPGPAL
ncbi:MAG: hypothetical protein R3D05_17705 [Dongiaceae bacterium]